MNSAKQELYEKELTATLLRNSPCTEDEFKTKSKGGSNIKRGILVNGRVYCFSINQPSIYVPSQNIHIENTSKFLQHRLSSSYTKNW